MDVILRSGRDVALIETEFDSITFGLRFILRNEFSDRRTTTSHILLWRQITQQ